MAYLNPDYITDIQVADIVARETVTDFHTLTDKAVESFCQSKGVLVDDIPVDGSNYASTYAVIEYARYFFYCEILQAFWGSATGEEDIYFDKIAHYKECLARSESETTKQRILQDDPLEPTDYMGIIPVY